MKKGLLILNAVTLSTLMALITLEANAQTPAAGTNGADNKKEFRQKVMQRFDTNHDGVISDSERAVMRETVIKENKEHNGQAVARQPGAEQKQDGGSSEPKNFHRQMMERFDVNHDGHLDASELMQMRQNLQSQGGRGPFNRPGQQRH